MPDAPQRPCKRPGCPHFTVPGSRYCSAHQPAAVAETAAKRAVLDSRRGSAHSRGYDAKWNTLSRSMRKRFPYSAGYLTRTAFWTHNLAQQFHALRVLAAGRNEFLRFMETGGAGVRFLEQFPIYTFHRSARNEPSEVTDHIIPHRGDPTLFWAEWNLQPISKRQHDEKTATYDGGFRGSVVPHAGPGARQTFGIV